MQVSSFDSFVAKGNDSRKERIMTDVLGYCIQREGSDVSDRILLQCVLGELATIERLQHEEDAASDSPARVFLLFLGGSCVFFMQAGFAMVCAGAVRKKNVQNTMLKNLLDACGASFAFFAVGFAFAFGGSDPSSPQKTFMGTTNFFLMNYTDYSFWLFQYAFSAASATIVAGALAERCQMTAYLFYSLLLSGFVYPIVVHALWDAQGFLAATSVDPLWGVGAIDFAGSGVVHVTGGATALLSATILGPRRGRFYDDRGRKLEKPKVIQGFSPALQVLGTFMLWYGWYSFNGASAITVELTNNTTNIAALAAANSTIAAGAAGLSGLLINMLFLLRENSGNVYYDIQFAMNGCLGGLVAITAPCAVVEPWAAVVIGIVAGFIYAYTNRLMLRWRIDDAVDAVPVHFFCGVWGLLATGLFTNPTRQLDAYLRNDHPGLLYSWWDGKSDFTLLGAQIVEATFITGWVCSIMIPFFCWLDYMGWLRSDPLEELIGLDVHEHGAMDHMEERINQEEDVGNEHLEAYRRRRQARNSEVIHKRSSINDDTAAAASTEAASERSDIDANTPSHRSV